MKKSKIFLPMMALALVFGLAACGGNNAQSQQSSGGQQSQSSIPAKPKITVTAAGDKKTLVMEETVQLSAKVDDKDLNGASWSSANEKVATVSATGLVTAVAPGEATISAALEGYTKGSITITVTRPAALATLHFEDAEHYSADGWWGTSDDGWSPEYARTDGNASDNKCIELRSIVDYHILKLKPLDRLPAVQFVKRRESERSRVNRVLDRLDVLEVEPHIVVPQTVVLLPHLLARRRISALVRRHHAGLLKLKQHG